MICELEHKIFTLEDTGFESFALALFQFQSRQNPVYRAYIDLLAIDPLAVTSASQIPFLPIDFFKTHKVMCTTFEPELVFESSGTTQTTPGRHYVKDASLYRESMKRTFRHYFGRPCDWCILGLLPSYLERQNSSLVYMVSELIRMSDHPDSGFYLNDHERLHDTLTRLQSSDRKILLVGVTFALLDFAEKYPSRLTNTVVIETGGMKGRRNELPREQVHSILKAAWNLEAIHSEYGMTELLSQAYSVRDGIFRCPPWMKVFVREEDDPFIVCKQGRGLINVIDLANIYSCAFIATDDVGRVYSDESFEVLGRRDNSDLRGCSLLVA